MSTKSECHRKYKRELGVTAYFMDCVCAVPGDSRPKVAQWYHKTQAELDAEQHAVKESQQKAADKANKQNIADASKDETGQGLSDHASSSHDGKQRIQSGADAVAEGLCKAEQGCLAMISQALSVMRDEHPGWFTDVYPNHQNPGLIHKPTFQVAP